MIYSSSFVWCDDIKLTQSAREGMKRGGTSGYDRIYTNYGERRRPIFLEQRQTNIEIETEFCTVLLMGFIVY